MNKRKKVISFSVHDENHKTHGRVSGKGMWLIVVSAENVDGESVVMELQNQGKVELSAFIPLVLNTLNECIQEMSPVTEAGFVVYSI